MSFLHIVLPMVFVVLLTLPEDISFQEGALLVNQLLLLVVVVHIMHSN